MAFTSCSGCVHQRLRFGNVLERHRLVSFRCCGPYNVSASSDVLTDSTKTNRFGRPNKTALRREAKGVLQLTRQICQLSDRQLSILGNVLTEEQIDAIEIAKKIPPRNQGRRRQEALIAKMFRSLDDEEQAQLQVAVDHATSGQTSTSHAFDQVATYWRDALINNDEGVTNEVFDLAIAHDVDLHTLRRLIRQHQVAKKQESSLDVAPNGTPDEHATQAASKSTLKKSDSKQLLRILRELAKAQQSDVEDASL